jgi:hypothetical protein
MYAKYCFLVFCFLFGVFIFFKLLKKSKHISIKKIFFSDKIEIFIQNVLYIFLLGAISKKKITVYIFFDDFYIDQNSGFFCYLQADCSKKNIQFFLENNFTNILFGIDKKGYIFFIFGSHNSISEIKISAKDAIEINYDMNSNLFDISTNRNCFEKNSLKKTVLILSEIFCSKKCD